MSQPEDVHRVVRRCDELIDQIPLPDPFDMRTFCDELGTMWGSTVVLYPTRTTPDGPCGMWVSLQVGRRTYDVFAYEQDASSWHQAQMVFHEIGHKLLDHVGLTELPLSTRELLAVMMPTIDIDVIERAVGCAREPSAYQDPKERDAEYIGARLLDRAIGWRSQPLGFDAPADLLRLSTVMRPPGTDGAHEWR